MIERPIEPGSVQLIHRDGMLALQWREIDGAFTRTNGIALQSSAKTVNELCHDLRSLVAAIDTSSKAVEHTHDGGTVGELPPSWPQATFEAGINASNE